MRVGRENCDMACTALALMTMFQEVAGDQAANNSGRNVPCRVRVLHVGGTLEKVENRYKQLSEAWLQTTAATTTSLN